MIFSINNEHGVDYQQQLEGHKHPINCLISSRDGRMASGDEKGSIMIWNNPNRTNDCTILYNEASRYLVTMVIYLVTMVTCTYVITM